MLRRISALVVVGTSLLSLGPIGAFVSASASVKPPVVKPAAAGLYDRQHIPNPTYLPVVNGAVVKVNWSDLQPVKGGPITVGNEIDQAVASAAVLNLANPALNLRLKLRVYTGVNAPEWAKQLDGPPVTLYDPQTSALIGTVGRFWTPRFKAAYDDLQAKLAARYDLNPVIADVVISRCTTQFAEPFLRQGALAVNRAAYLAAGYTVAKDQVCLSEQIDTHARTWTRTRSSLAFNPYQAIDPAGVRIDEPYTESMMVYCRQVLGARCVLGSNSLGWPLAGGAYTALYSRLTALGPPLYFQTETAAKLTDWRPALEWAANSGANMVEMNTAYDPEYPLSETGGFDAALERNPCPS